MDAPRAAPRSAVRVMSRYSRSAICRVLPCRFGCQICRVHAQDLESIRPEIEALGGRIYCVGHEHFGEGSDSDRSWEAGGYFRGTVWSNPDKSLYTELFTRKTLLSGYGLFDMSRERLAQVKARSVTGNFKGDGFQLGGTFVIDTDGTVVLDSRAKFSGDDASNDAILSALRSCKGLKPPTPAAVAAAAAAAAAGSSSAAGTPAADGAAAATAAPVAAAAAAPVAAASAASTCKPAAGGAGTVECEACMA